MTRRITRKQLKQSDEFVSTVDTIIQWMVDNWRPIVAGLGAICIIAVGWWLVGLWSESRADDASLALRRAVTTFEGDDSIGQMVPAGNADEAETELQQVIDNFSSSDQADMARLYLARIHFDRGETDAARDLLVGLAERRRNDPIGRVATLDLIHLRIASGQATEVAAELEAMVVGTDTGLPRDVALYELGQLYLAEQNPIQAREYFTTLVEEFPESPYLQSAQQRLAELG
ncbi:MAG: tetratricopeptide repeat protein [Holophagae bacterium]|jgi:predicted negative regulator of RcsB-dependent stress response